MTPKFFFLSRIWLKLQFLKHPNTCYSKLRRVSCLPYHLFNLFCASRMRRLCVVWCGVDWIWNSFRDFQLGRQVCWLFAMFTSWHSPLICRDCSLSSRPFQNGRWSSQYGVYSSLLFLRPSLMINVLKVDQKILEILGCESASFKSIIKSVILELLSWWYYKWFQELSEFLNLLRSDNIS